MAWLHDPRFNTRKRIWIPNIIFKHHQGHPDTSKKLSPQLLVLAHFACHSQICVCRIGRGISSIHAHGYRPACKRPLAITTARGMMRMEQARNDAVQLCWLGTFG